METLTRSSILISIVCVLVVRVIFAALNWLWLRPKKLERWLRQQGLPGTSYSFFANDMKYFGSMAAVASKQPMKGFSHDYFARIEPFRHQLMTKYGRNCFMWAGTRPLIQITTPDLIRDALTKMQHLQKTKLNPIADKIFPGLVGYEGDKWVKHRKMINPAFHMEKLKLMLPAFCDSCTEMTSKWEELTAETGSSEIDVWPYLTTLSADVISRAAFGSSYKEGRNIFDLLKEQIGLTLNTIQTLYIPGSRYIPTASNQRFKKIEHEIQGLLVGIINKRKEAIEAGHAPQDDLLGILLDSNSKEIQQATVVKNKKQQLGMSIEEVIDECKLFYLAGQETTSILLVWTLILLSKHQDWQARAREEVLQTFGNNKPNAEGLTHLKTVTMILNEVLRLYPPATQLARRVMKDVKLGDISVPAGAFVNIQLPFLHQDKEIWGEDALEFKPDRFSEGISKATSGNISFFPFGWGPRTCIGEKFAITEVKMALSMILQRFSLELSSSYTHAPTTVFFLQPQHGAQIILHKCKS